MLIANETCLTSWLPACKANVIHPLPSLPRKNIFSQQQPEVKDWESAAQVQWNSWRGSLFVGRSTSQSFAFSSTKISVKAGWYCHFISSCSLLTFQTSISFVYSAKSRQFRLVLRDSLCVAWDWRFRVYSAGSSAKNQWGYWWVSWSCYYGLDWGTTVFGRKLYSVFILELLRRLISFKFALTC